MPRLDGPATVRLDLALVARGLARSRSHAQELVRSGLVRVDGQPAPKPSLAIAGTAQVAVDDHDGWVSRAAHKLLGALDDLGWASLPPRVLDAGASTGGFTQVVLGRGAQRVYAIDVGHDQLAPELRADPRVVVREGLNLRHLALGDCDDQPVDLVVGDVSFISLKLLLEPLFAVLGRHHPGAADPAEPAGKALLLVKPQFEVGRPNLGSGGVVRDPGLRAEAVAGVVEHARTLGWQAVWQGPSRLPGPAGNVEHFVCLAPGDPSSGPPLAVGTDG